MDAEGGGMNRTHGGADLVEVYTDRDGATTCAREWRTSQRIAKVRIFKRTVRAGGGFAVVYAVCTWYTEAAKVHGWNV
jgi:hypothetical protein